MLGLPDPTSDELGRPVWPCTAADVSRAYRRLSVSVHPDKNPGEDARKAFEALNQAHRILKDPGERVGEGPWLDDHSSAAVAVTVRACTAN